MNEDIAIMEPQGTEQKSNAPSKKAFVQSVESGVGFNIKLVDNKAKGSRIDTPP